MLGWKLFIRQTTSPYSCALASTLLSITHTSSTWTSPCSMANFRNSSRKWFSLCSTAKASSIASRAVEERSVHDIQSSFTEPLLNHATAVNVVSLTSPFSSPLIWETKRIYCHARVHDDIIVHRNDDDIIFHRNDDDIIMCSCILYHVSCYNRCASIFPCQRFAWHEQWYKLRLRNGFQCAVPCCNVVHIYTGRARPMHGQHLSSISAASDSTVKGMVKKIWLHNVSFQVKWQMYQQ